MKMVDITKHPYFSYRHIVDPLFERIRKQIYVQPQVFSRKYPNQERFEIVSNKELWIDYHSSEFYQYGLFEKDSQKYESGFHMWDHLPCDPHNIYEYARREHSVAHGLTIIQQHGEYCDMFLFATKPNNSQINNFYLNQKKLFEEFIVDFYSALAPTLLELSHHKIFVPFNTSDDESPLITLSPRQQDCALLMAQGLTAKEIAKALNLSPRTVEEYIDILKAKFGAKNRVHLLGMLQKHL
jgi:DNA-binding CsgD family transcriptional regulator